jgi:hypothetical protein
MIRPGRRERRRCPRAARQRRRASAAARTRQAPGIWIARAVRPLGEGWATRIPWTRHLHSPPRERRARWKRALPSAGSADMSEVGGDEGRLGAGTACQCSAILAATPPRQSRGSAIGTVERLHGINFNNGRIGNPVREDRRASIGRGPHCRGCSGQALPCTRPEAGCRARRDRVARGGGVGQAATGAIRISQHDRTTCDRPGFLRGPDRRPTTCDRDRPWLALARATYYGRCAAHVGDQPCLDVVNGRWLPRRSWPCF